MIHFLDQMVSRNFARLVPRIQIHTWGGLGSQLFALIVATRVQNISRHRRVRMVFHTSGVTRRYLEIPSQYLLNFEVRIVDDFRLESELTTSTRTLTVKRGFISLIKYFLQKTNFLVSLNTEDEMSDLRWWTLQIRGHYGRVNVSVKELQLIKELIGSTVKGYYEQIPGVAIHFRLGDLMYLENKSYISQTSIIPLLSKHPNNVPVRIFSDSPKEDVLKVWPFLWLYSDVQIFHLSAFQTALHCIASNTFVGTSAKLSIWIAMIRIGLHADSHTYMPNSLGPSLKELLKNVPRVNLNLY